MLEPTALVLHSPHCFTFTKFTRLGEPKGLYEADCPAGSPFCDDRVTLLLVDEPAFCFSFKWFAMFCKEMYDKLASPR